MESRTHRNHIRGYSRTYYQTRYRGYVEKTFPTVNSTRRSRPRITIFLSLYVTNIHRFIKLSEDEICNELAWDGIHEDYPYYRRNRDGYICIGLRNDLNPEKVQRYLNGINSYFDKQMNFYNGRTTSTVVPSVPASQSTTNTGNINGNVTDKSSSSLSNPHVSVPSPSRSVVVPPVTGPIIPVSVDDLVDSDKEEEEVEEIHNDWDNANKNSTDNKEEKNADDDDDDENDHTGENEQENYELQDHEPYPVTPVMIDSLSIKINEIWSPLSDDMETLLPLHTATSTIGTEILNDLYDNDPSSHSNTVRSDPPLTEAETEEALTQLFLVMVENAELVYNLHDPSTSTAKSLPPGTIDPLVNYTFAREHHALLGDWLRSLPPGLQISIWKLVNSLYRDVYGMLYKDIDIQIFNDPSDLLSQLTAKLQSFDNITSFRSTPLGEAVFQSLKRLYPTIPDKDIVKYAFLHPILRPKEMESGPGYREIVSLVVDKRTVPIVLVSPAKHTSTKTTATEYTIEALVTAVKDSIVSNTDGHIGSNIAAHSDSSTSSSVPLATVIDILHVNVGEFSDVPYKNMYIDYVDGRVQASTTRPSDDVRYAKKTVRYNSTNTGTEHSAMLDIMFDAQLNITNYLQATVLLVLSALATMEKLIISSSRILRPRTTKRINSRDTLHWKCTYHPSSFFYHQAQQRLFRYYMRGLLDPSFAFQSTITSANDVPPSPVVRTNSLTTVTLKKPEQDVTPNRNRKEVHETLEKLRKDLRQKKTDIGDVIIEIKSKDPENIPMMTPVPETVDTEPKVEISSTTSVVNNNEASNTTVVPMDTVVPSLTGSSVPAPEKTTEMHNTSVDRSGVKESEAHEVPSTTPSVENESKASENIDETNNVAIPNEENPDKQKVEDVINILRTKSASNTVPFPQSDYQSIENALTQFYNFACDPYYRNIIGSIANGIECVTDILIYFPNDLAIQRLVCKVLCQTAVANETNKNLIKASKGIPRIIMAMDTFQNDAVLQAYGCNALRCLAENSGERRLLIAENEGILTVLNALDNHPGSNLVQSYGCWALAKLAEHDANNRDTIHDNDGISKVLTAMQLYLASDSSVLQHACQALINIGRAKKTYRKIMVRKNVRYYVEKALEIFAADVKLHHYGTALLRKLGNK